MFACLALLIACGFCIIVFADNHEEEDMNKLVFPEAYKIEAVANGGKISGVVKFDGEVPEKKKLAINKDPAVCDTVAKYDESLVVGEGNVLKNTIVYLMDVTKGKDFDKDAKVELDQKDCRFDPHVQIIPVGATLTVLNSDKATHNVHIFGTKKNNTSVNKQQPRTRKKMRLSREGVAKGPEGPVEVKCDIHGWMRAWVAYVPHPYFAVTNEKGEFTLEDVPAGTYKLGYWHEMCGTNNKEPVAITVEAGGEVEQDFTLKVKETK